MGHCLFTAAWWQEEDVACLPWVLYGTVGSANNCEPKGGCYKPVLGHTNPVIYHIPASVETTETLENANLSGDRVDSMFPPGQIKSNDQIYWQGISGLSPSLNATNLAAEARNSEYTFVAGILYGLGLSLVFAFVQLVLTTASRDKKGNTATSGD